jgi:anthranilate synthase component 1
VPRADRVKKSPSVPLAGTTSSRCHSRNWIKAAEAELDCNDPKERAEHVMLIDLARNDIGRIAKIGSVKVSDAFCGGTL